MLCARRNDLSPIVNSKDFGLKEALTPVVFRVKNNYFMVFAGKTPRNGRKIYIAYSDDLVARATRTRILIDGPREKKKIIPGIKSEVALNTPCPIIRNEELWLYYGAMDRANGVWKTALSIFPL